MVLANCLLILATFFLHCLHLTDGCGRTPARTKPSPSTEHPGSITSTPGRPVSHRQTCTEVEASKVSCLNGGECFAIRLSSSRNLYCQCGEMWRGNRCEEADGDYYGRVFSADKVEKAGIAAGVVVVIIIITVIIVYFVIKKRKQRRKRSEENGDVNGHAGKLLQTDAEKHAAAELEETKV